MFLEIFSKGRKWIKQDIFAFCRNGHLCGSSMIASKYGDSSLCGFCEETRSFPLVRKLRYEIPDHMSKSNSILYPANPNSVTQNVTGRGTSIHAPATCHVCTDMLQVPRKYCWDSNYFWFTVAQLQRSNYRETNNVKEFNILALREIAPIHLVLLPDLPRDGRALAVSIHGGL